MSRTRAVHRSEALAQISFARPTSRAELVARTGLSRATITRITRELVRGRVLREVDFARRSVGRPSRGLEVNADFGAVAGVSLLPPFARAVVMDFRGGPLGDLQEPIDWSQGAEGILASLRRLVRAAARHRALGSRPLRGVGLALPGQFDKARGISRVYPRVPGWKDVPLRGLLSEWSGVPAALIGYAPSIALAELSRRTEAPQGLLAVEATDNIALGVVVNGTLLEGASGNAGELGHITVDPRGGRCYCGNTGCLELYGACRAVEDEARRRRLGTGRFEAIAGRARKGDAAARRLLEGAAKHLGVGIATAVNLFNPEIVVLGGRFFDAEDLVLAPLRASVSARALSSSVKPLTLERSSLGVLAPALGAGVASLRETLTRV